MNKTDKRINNYWPAVPSWSIERMKYINWLMFKFMTNSTQVAWKLFLVLNKVRPKHDPETITILKTYKWSYIIFLQLIRPNKVWHSTHSSAHSRAQLEEKFNLWHIFSSFSQHRLYNGLVLRHYWVMLINYETFYNELVNEEYINGDWIQPLNSKTLT